MAAELLEASPNPEALIAALLKHSYDELLDEGNYREIEDVKVDKTGKARLFIALGKKDKMTAKKLVDMIKRKTTVKDKSIKRVEIYENFSFMTVPFAEAEEILARDHR